MILVRFLCFALTTTKSSQKSEKTACFRAALAFNNKVFDKSRGDLFFLYDFIITDKLCDELVGAYLIICASLEHVS